MLHIESLIAICLEARCSIAAPHPVLLSSMVSLPASPMPSDRMRQGGLIRHDNGTRFKSIKLVHGLACGLVLACLSILQPMQLQAPCSPECKTRPTQTAMRASMRRLGPCMGTTPQSSPCREPSHTIISRQNCMFAGYMDPGNSVSFLSVISSDHSDSRQSSWPQSPYQADALHHEEVCLLRPQTPNPQP